MLIVYAATALRITRKDDWPAGQRSFFCREFATMSSAHRTKEKAIASKHQPIERVYEVIMIVNFRNNTLRANYEDVNQATRAWGTQVARRYIQRIEQIEAMPTFHDLYSIRGLRLHPLKGNRRGQFALTLTGRYRLIIERDDPSDTVLVSEVSNHYDD